MLIDLQNREDRWDDVGNEVVEEALIIVVKLNCELALRGWRAVVELEEVDVECLFGE